MRHQQPDKERIEFDAPTSQGIELEPDGGNAYAAAVDAGHRMEKRSRRIFVMAVVLVVVLAVEIVAPKGLFEQAVSSYNHAWGTLSYAVVGFQENVSRFVLTITGQAEPNTPASMSGVLFRYVAIMLSGAGLALTGAVYQSTFRNALVAPSTLGVMSGAQLGMVLWVTIFITTDGFLLMPDGQLYTMDMGASDPFAYFWYTSSMAVCSFLFCFVVVGLDLLILKLAGRGAKSPLMIIIAGQIIASICSGICTTIVYYYVSAETYTAKTEILQYLSLATFYRQYSLTDIVAIGVPLAITVAVILGLHGKMMALTFSEGEARAMGVESRKIRVLTIFLCTLLTAIIVSFCGAIGFVGFLVPHLTRRVVGPDSKYLFPATCLMGSIFVLGAYALVDITLGNSLADYTGAFIAMGGTVVFLVSVLRGGGRDYGRFPQ